MAVGFGLALVSLIFGGWSRLISPLTWQSDRGLQIESVWATPLMIFRAFRPSGWQVYISKYQAYEIFGPGAKTWVTISTVATLLGLAVIVALFVRAFRAGGSDPIAIGFVVMSTVAIMTVTNKTLSPQYLLWLAGPLAALLLLRPDGSDEERRAVSRMSRQLVVLALLTHLIFPLLYNSFLGHKGQVMIVVATLVTAIRNLALVLFTVECCRYAWRSLDADRAET